jgi:hypothetical protein
VRVARTRGAVSAQAQGASAATSTVAVNVGTIANDNAAHTTATVTVKDSAGAVVVGVTPEVLSTDGSAVISAPSASDAEGLSTCTVKSNSGSAGAKTVSFKVAGRLAASTTTYTVTADAVNPTVASVGPASGPATGLTTVVVNGTGFQGGAGVTFGAANATDVEVNSDTSIKCVIPAHATGAVSVIVTNTDTGANEANTAFTYGTTIKDIRVGQAQSIQAAADLAAARTASGLYAGEHCPEVVQNGVTYRTPSGVQFATDVDGAGLHAFRWDVLKNAGNPNGCVAGGYSQHDWSIYKDIGELASNGGTLVLQHKVWAGRTTTGGGYGDSVVGSYVHGGKRLVWYRKSSGDTQGRFDCTHDPSGPLFKFIVQATNGEAGTGTAVDARSNGLEIRTGTGGVPASSLNFNDYINGPMTLTYVFRSESSAGATDGLFQWWVGEDCVLNIADLAIGTLGWAEMQIGGPTFGCPTQDQTEYFYDVIVWSY